MVATTAGATAPKELQSRHPEMGWAELIWAQQREDFPSQEHKYSSLVPWNKLLGILFFIFIPLFCFYTIGWILMWTEGF